MRKRKTIISVILAASGLFGGSCVSYARDLPVYETLPAKMDGTMMPYDFRHGDSITPWTYTRMEPVAVAYVARHGARYLSSEKKVEPLLKAVRTARERRSLTADGRAFSALLDTVRAVSHGKWGDLSTVGSAEEARLGQQLCALLGPLGEKLVANAESSSVPRVVRTMWEFLYPVAARSQKNSVTTAEGPQFSPLVRFFDTDSVYAGYIKDGNWTSSYDAFFERTVPTEPAHRLFGNIGDENELRKLTMEIYGVLQSLRASGLPAPTTQWMTESEYRACWMVSNLKRYLTRSVTPLSDEAMRACAPLLRTVIERTDEAVEKVRKGEEGVNGNFWFGHAETLLPLTALMGLPGCVSMPKEWSELTDVWRDYNITPLGANVLIVLLRDRERAEIHAAVRLNGSWVSPISGEGLLPTWESLRTYWLNRIERFSR